MSFPAYSNYKESDVAGLGEVPIGWTVMRLKHVAQVFASNVDKKEHEGQAPVSLCNYKDVYYNERIQGDMAFMVATASDEQVARFTLRGGDTLVTKDSETPDDIGISAYVPADIPGVVCGYHLSVVRPRANAEGAFLKRYFDSAPAKAWFRVRSNGLTRVGLSQYALDNAPIAVPEIVQQRTIAQFLDRETAKIDLLIMEQRHLIGLLVDKRQAVVSHAFSKGIVAGTPMKTTGIEWLADVPEHWEITRIGNLYRESAAVGDDNLPILTVSIHRGVSDYELSDDEMERNVARSDDRTKYKRVEPNDLAYNMMRAWQGGFGAVRVEGQVSPAYVVAKPIRDIRSEFVEALLRTPNAMTEIRRYSRGVADFRLRLYWDEFKNIRIALPPPSEVDEILAHCAALSDQYLGLEGACKEAIALLQERRSALISAAVTGKIDVRAFVPENNVVSIESARASKALPPLRSIVGAYAVVHFGKLGRMAVMKAGFLAEAHSGFHELNGRYERNAAGPYDGNLIAAMERGAGELCCISTCEPQQEGQRVTYTVPPNPVLPSVELTGAVGAERAKAFENLLAILNGISREGVEAIATIYAVWNDLLAAAKSADDDAISSGVLNDWHPEKAAKFKQDDIAHWLAWMRRHNVVPNGTAPRTDHQGSLFA